ncbi:MAG: hypothetical protein K2N05_01210, partial [Muribaculaceae bacterium]|nr:hypothetical protein [Muribaculaceae bacterium]
PTESLGMAKLRLRKNRISQKPFGVIFSLHFHISSLRHPKSNSHNCIMLKIIYIHLSIVKVVKLGKDGRTGEPKNKRTGE